MEYISSGTANDSFTDTMNQKVNTLRSNDGAKERYIVWYQMVEQEKAIAREEGLAEGELRGTIKVYCHFIKEGKWTLEQAAANLNMSVGEFTRKAKALAVL